MAETAIRQIEYSPGGKLRSSTSTYEFGSVEQNIGVLFASKGGLSLPAEICLKIVEDVVSADPKVGSWALSTLSKSFGSLNHAYEHSIVKTVSLNEGTAKLYPTILLSSWPRDARTFAHSYPWLCEVRCRAHTIESLIKHEVTTMLASFDGHIAIDLPLPDVPETELLLRTERLKRDAIHLLYGMADCTAACSSIDIHSIRENQCSYLESLATTQLAMLGVFTRILGVGYYRMMKSKHPRKDCDSVRDRWVVFEDRVLRYGPFFAWAAGVERTGTIHEWSEDVISDALEDMEAFETGRVQGYASLQSVLWKLFCVRKECDMIDSWEEARETVEIEMLNYEV